ncbi:snf2 family helicase [Drepanopeziza brunnea f. sp. 'multigermtubi' MB_m1]|uniref:Snf2 family helicase n=1 Tax=Marssonina brunnea f. sp. multigermtubi (strain MB_m1) TaxID=1072389 RepID=K1WUW9_MARBU|nr:snf2 family helicase [Drepanopeziza brunnea f. sp. 'multigermtubi' MB_m1]EKD16227.1 snf2 family helicase [Drepanopeziza brunnea f. sp. 'multigermtubi' MB_m1]
MSSSKPLIYAELLSNIRQISVIVALEGVCESATKAELSADGWQFIFYHEGQKTVLGLPGQAVANFQLQKPILGNKELSWRLPLAGQASRASIEDAQSNEAPWSAKDISEDAEFACRECKAVILEKGTVRVWKDLPSENWAEMMDYWHCHKPDAPVALSEANGSSGQESRDFSGVAASKGYGANTRFLARSGIGLINITTFLLASVDCKNLKGLLGLVDSQAGGIRIYKWRLTLLPDCYLVTMYCPNDLYSVRSEALRIIVLYCYVQYERNLYLMYRRFINNPRPDFRHAAQLQAFAYFNCVVAGPKLAMKVFWKLVTSQDAVELLDSSNVEDVQTPTEGIREIEGVLRESAFVLPPSARKFKDWDVGLLERYQAKQ